MQDKKLVSLDLETLSTRNDAAIIAIGVAVWHPDLIHTDKWVILTQRWLIQPSSAVGHRDPATIDWWNQQDPAIREEVWGGRKSAMEVIKDFVFFIKDFHFESEVEFWAGPAHFDFPIIEHLIHLAGLELPWTYRQKKCLSTFAREMKNAGFLNQDVDSERLHEPVADATAQLMELLAYKKTLKRAANYEQEGND